MKYLGEIYILCSFTLITSIIVQPKGPSYRKLTVRCVNDLLIEAMKFIKDKYTYYPQFVLTYVKTVELTSPFLQIQEEILKDMSNNKTWSVEVLGNESYEFESYNENCDTPSNNPNNYRGIFLHPPRCVRKHALIHKTQLYLMILENFDEFYEKVDFLPTSPTFNGEALFIIYFTKSSSDHLAVAEKIIYKLFDYSVTRSVVMMPHDVLSFEIYGLEINNYPNKTCYSNLNVKLTDRCEKGILSKTSRNVFQENTKIRFNQCILKVQALRFEPFVINKHEGFEIGILNVIGKALNITFEILLHDTEEIRFLGRKDENGTWIGFVEPIFKSWNLGIGSIVPDDYYMTDFAYSIGYYSQELAFIVHTTNLIPRWRVLLAIFSLQMWCIIWGVMLGFTILFYFSKTKRDTNFRTFQKCYASSFEVIIGVPVPSQPVSHFTRVFFIGLAIFGIIINAIYTSSLVYYLQNPVREPAVTGARDIFSAGMVVGGSLKIRSLFEASPNPVVRKLLKTFQTENKSLDSYKYWLKQVSTKKKIVTIAPKICVKYLISKKSPLVTDSRGDSKVKILENTLLTQNIGIMMRKGAFAEKALNAVLQKLIIQGGIGTKLKNELLMFGKMESFSSSPNSVEDNNEDEDDAGAVLTVYHLEGAFVILALGFAFSILTFIFEHICFHVKKFRKAAKN